MKGSSMKRVLSILLVASIIGIPMVAKADVPIISYRSTYTGAGTVTGPIITLTGQNVCVVTTSGGSSGGTVTVKGSSVGAGTLTTLTQFGSSGVITTDNTFFGSLTGTVPALTNFTYVKTGTVTGTLTVVETCSPAGGLLASNISGVVPAANGGTGQSSYTIGDLLYASGATTLSKLAAVATGSALISAGIGTAPSWGTPVAATSATNLTTTEDASTNATYCPPFQTASAGTNPFKTDCSNLTYNPSTSVFTVKNLAVTAPNTSRVACINSSHVIADCFAASVGPIFGALAASCSSSAFPCKFTWTCTMSSGACTTTATVPVSATCVVTPNVSPDLSSTNVVSTWVTLSSTTLTIHVSDMLGTSSSAFSGNGMCL